MKTIDVNSKNPLIKLLVNKRAINECIRKNGDLKKLQKDRGIKFATPISIS